MVKKSLSWLRFLGLPTLCVDRNKSSNQTNDIATTFRRTKRMWLWLWISGTRAKTDHISSGFYYIARDAGIPIVFACLDYRSKTMCCSAALDPSKLSKEECLAAVRAWAELNDLGGAGCVPENASTLAFRKAKST
jgi:hypothetical protein